MDLPASPSHDLKRDAWKHTLLLSFQSLGIVYGRLSTAPLYVFSTIDTYSFTSNEMAFELFSFIFWTITILSLLKYAVIVLRADDNGEGGTFALYSLLCRHAKVSLLPNEMTGNEEVQCGAGSSDRKAESRARRLIEKHRSSHYLILVLALFGACMMIGDGIFTPALSVLSASTGVQRSLSAIARKFTASKDKQADISDAFEKYVPVPLACAILVCLFMVQRYGTHKIGVVFAPIIVMWLLFISGVGVYNIFRWDISILGAISPRYMYRFMKNIHYRDLKSLGSVILSVAGSEAMFANLGHFSKKSIKITYLYLIYPVLIFSYAGQAAYISKNWKTKDFEHLSESVPSSIRHVFTVLSLFASVVGSQATVTATFSIINQCQALCCFPRVKVIHTSDKINGQIYIPDVNWGLMILSLSITIGFHDMKRIGFAAGLAIISGMLVTTFLMSLVIALCWQRNVSVSACFLIFFGSVEALFLSACLLNFHKGAWYMVIPLVISLTVMLSWHYGTMEKYKFDLENKVSVDWLTELSPGLGVSRIPGIGFIYTDITTGVPAFFSHFITNLPAFHEILIFVSFKSLPVPHVGPGRRYLIGRVGSRDHRIYRCIVRYGYCDRVRDSDDFEDHIIRSIGEFISLEERERERENYETLIRSPERMIVVGNPGAGPGNALIPLNNDSDGSIAPALSVGAMSNCEEGQSPRISGGSGESGGRRRKRVRFALPQKSPEMGAGVREELQELIDGRESGTAYFIGQSHLAVREPANVVKRLLVMTYAFLDKNCREPHVALNIPHAALVEVGMVYTI